MSTTPTAPGPFDDADLPLLRDGTAAVAQAAEQAARAADPPAEPHTPSPDEYDDDADEYDEFDPDDEDEEDAEAWRIWLEDTPETGVHSGVQLTPRGVWDVPDYDALQDEHARGAVLVDRSGRRGRNTLHRRRRDPGERSGRGRGGNALLSAVIGVGLAVIVAAVVINLGVLGGPTARPRAAAPTSAPATAAVSTTAPDPTTSAAAAEAADVATPGCVQDTSGPDHASGTTPGDTSSAPAVILAFEHAYYVQRSGAAARALVTTDSPMPAAAAIQSGIDQVPTGTRYCVDIAPAAAGGGAIWNVTLTEQWPGETASTWHQSITTSRIGTRVLISAIGPNE